MPPVVVEAVPENAGVGTQKIVNGDVPPLVGKMAAPLEPAYPASRCGKTKRFYHDECGASADRYNTYNGSSSVDLLVNKRGKFFAALRLWAGKNAALAVAADIYRAFVSQVAEGAEPQANHFPIEGVEFAQGRNADQNPVADPNFSLKRALGRNHLANQVGLGGVADIQTVQPLPQGAEDVKRERGFVRAAFLEGARESG
jgi:hypothetical protein